MGDPLRDPLRGLSRQQRGALELLACAYFDKYNPHQHRGWFAEASREGKVVICVRLDLDHPIEPGNSRTKAGCIDCDAHLQRRADDPDGDTPKICLVCAHKRAINGG